MNNRYIRIHPSDNVAVALSDLQTGEVLGFPDRSVRLAEPVPAGHKVALMQIEKGDEIIKYGYPIGRASVEIAEGEWVDEHKVRTSIKNSNEYVYHPVNESSEYQNSSLYFSGYLRKNGDCGVRNEIWIIPMVGCVNGIAQRLAARLESETACRNVDAIRAFSHPYGCSQLGDDLGNTRRILADLVKHPNAGGALVVALGCENNRLEDFLPLLGTYGPERVRFLVCQQENDEEEAGMEMLRQIYAEVSCDRRTPQPLSALRVGLKCGGSDGFSGITANPLLGRFSDFLISRGGSAVMTEVPEMFGAETLLMDRCCNEETFCKTARLIQDFKDYFLKNGQPVYENPSPGNKAGGISTLEEKSLGCTQKSGTAPVRDVLQYGERWRKAGLSLLSAPGNDLVASTALAAAGCQLILFTTGRGTPFGTSVPTFKIASNTRIYLHKRKWMDFNAGVLAEGQGMDEVLDRLIRCIVRTASGEKTANENNGYAEIAVFKTGITL